ncbi:MAG TPA: TIGR03619 family F420-dependent LLM class oxidoreductase [Candidatus Acidoferrales bacterium]|nr:TIGR03619 family F420-dependent LLM class oxidoreductase [Candidatus Acidoferrales bacterium]
MKVRIGVALGDSFADDNPDALLSLIDDCERWDIDSIWVSDRIVGPRPTLDPVVFMAYLASRMGNMKFGTSALVLPTRQPVLLAKQLATLDFLCKGKLLLAVGLGGDDSRDFEAAGVRKEERGKRADEAIVLMKKLWSEEQVNFDGQFYSAHDLTLLPRPHQKGGPPLWVGGRSKAALRRVGRLADGWLVSSVTAGEVRAGINEIRAYAGLAGREIPEDHYGVLAPYLIAPNSDEAEQIARPLARRRPDIAPQEYSALGTAEHVFRKLHDYIDAGATKFVMRPLGPKESLRQQIEILAKEVIPALQTPFNALERKQRLA